MAMEDVTEDEITLQEALEEQELLENQCMAVLGASDPLNCSYTKGYMKRQALYACLTCNPKGAPFSQSGGICLACSNHCHEGHEMVELFTKRNFRCDCGNKKFPDNACRLQANKDEVNSENAYNQNFMGTYCSCARPYPDPDANNEVADDTMIQCIICEDWYHLQHCLKYLNVDLEASEEDYELICGSCMSRLEFLQHYSELALKPVKLVIEKEGSDEVKDTPATAIAENGSKSSDEKIEPHVEETSKDSGVDCSQGSDTSSNASAACPLVAKPKGALPFSEVNAIIWKARLRKLLCRCPTCMSMYKTLKVEYLLDEEDTIDHYEAMGKEKVEAAQLAAEASMNDQVNQLGRVGQLEFIHGINNFKEQLSEFLKGHAEKGTVIQRDHINDFFDKMKEEQAAKRRRLE